LQPISKYDRSQESKENTELDVDTDPLQSFPSLDAEQLAMLIGLAKSDDHDIGGAQPAGPHAEELEPLVASIAQVVPDVQLDCLSALVKQTLVTDGPAEVAERIIALLLTNPCIQRSVTSLGKAGRNAERVVLGLQISERER
jgi:hypothetical protein